jgi:acetoin utilization deacetylase AcuC-like enzyme
LKVFFHSDFYQVYTSDPAAGEGRMEAVVNALSGSVEWMDISPASREDIALAHSNQHIENIRADGLYHISSLAAGGAIQAAETGLREPCFALIRPPGHHASENSSWGFCFFNNMAIALEALKNRNKIKSAFVLDFDLHYGDGNVNILGQKDWVTIYNPESHNRNDYIKGVESVLSRLNVDIIGISAGFDNHLEDWGGLLTTEDYSSMGAMVRSAADKSGAGCFAILEGGYNHDVLGMNVKALIDGMDYQTP